MYKTNKICKRIIGVSLFLFVFFFLFGYSALAEIVDDDKLLYCTEAGGSPEEGVINSRFKFSLAKNGSNVTLSMGKCESGVTFTVSSIDNHPVSGVTLGCGHTSYTYAPTSQSDPNHYVSDDFGLWATGVTLVATDVPSNNANGCYWESVSLSLELTLDDTGDVHDYDPDHGSLISPSENSIINCDNNTYKKGGTTYHFTTGDGSFEDKFCNAKRLATIKKDFGSGKNNDTYTFKCETDFVSHPEIMYPNELEGDDYFVNKNYLYGKNEVTQSQTIQFHLSPGGDTTSVKLSCKIKCEEAVEVEYGPPVAVSAGVCFQYIVRVTSRVSCNVTDIHGSDQVCKSNYCNPVPQCIHNGGKITQGGPSEDFDACIQSCDGGNYTKKCNTKCYKEVYGSAVAYANVMSTYHDDIFATKVEYKKNAAAMRGTSYTCEGYYKRVGSSISWVGTHPTKGAYSAGRWYCDNRSSWKPLSDRSCYVTDGYGLFRKVVNNNGGLCSESCSWKDCGSTEYLNKCVPDSVAKEMLGISVIDSSMREGCGDVDGNANGLVNIIKYDCDRNTQIYNDFVKACESKISCSTEVSTFTVDVDYTRAGDTAARRVSFPYSNGVDTIRNGGGSVSSTHDQPNTTLLYNYPTDGEGQYGCYKSGASETNLYRATWGFPSSWQNLKTGEFSYDYNGKTSSVWLEHKKRFCLPGDAMSVNEKWYNSIMNRVLRDKNIVTTIQDSRIDDLCKYTDTTTSIAHTTYPPTSEQLIFNIFAHTKKFGYMLWNIDLQCLYAVNEDPLYDGHSLPTEIVECDSSSDNDEALRIHTVDLTDMFPSPDGGGTTAAGSSSERIPGFNWSEYATNDKNLEYKSNPKAYRDKIKTGVDYTYNNNKLDYWFKLSPSTIRKMRKSYTGSTANYTAFRDSDFKVSNGVSRYTSALIHGNSFIAASDKKVPSESSAALSCNNMINYQSNGCCDHEDNC